MRSPTDTRTASEPMSLPARHDAFVVMALGFADGPHAGRHVRLVRASVGTAKNAIANQRTAAPDAVACVGEVVITGEIASRAVFDRAREMLMDAGRHKHGSWFEATDGEAAQTLVDAAAAVGVRTTTREEIAAAEQQHSARVVEMHAGAKGRW